MAGWLGFGRVGFGRVGFEWVGFGGWVLGGCVGGCVGFGWVGGWMKLSYLEVWEEFGGFGWIRTWSFWTKGPRSSHALGYCLCEFQGLETQTWLLGLVFNIPMDTSTGSRCMKSHLLVLSLLSSFAMRATNRVAFFLPCGFPVTGLVQGSPTPHQLLGRHFPKSQRGFPRII